MIYPLECGFESTPALKLRSEIAEGQIWLEVSLRVNYTTDEYVITVGEKLKSSL